MYWFSLLLILLVILVISKFSLTVGLTDLLSQLGRWVVCGLFDFPFLMGITDFPAINNVSISWYINAGIFWTLIYEVQFYLILPLLTVFTKLPRFFCLVIFICALNTFAPSWQAATMLNLLAGMATAYLVKQFSSNRLILSCGFSIATLLLLATIPLVFHNKNVIPIAWLAFIPLACGNNLFGLLTISASRLLGTISYSIYLMHGIVLFVTLNLIDKVVPIKGMSPWIFWLIIGFCGVLIILTSSLTYRFIEHPFLQKKRQFRSEV
jgi:peptidoglycan/LPS O-acetylase OafA/YrhL